MEQQATEVNKNLNEVLVNELYKDKTTGVVYRVLCLAADCSTFDIIPFAPKIVVYIKNNCGEIFACNDENFLSNFELVCNKPKPQTFKQNLILRLKSSDFVE